MIIVTKIHKGGTYYEQVSTIKPGDDVITWSWEIVWQTKNMVFHSHKA